MTRRKQDPAPPQTPKVAPSAQDPTLPFPGIFADYPSAWKAIHSQLKAQAKRSKPTVVFLGDSLTQNWLDPSGGKKEWDQHVAPLGALNLGIGGDKTSQVLWRIQDGVLDGLTPKVVVLLIGVNNLWKNEFGNARVTEGILACADAVHTRCPQAKVLLIGMFPAQNPASHPLRAIIKEINAKVAEKVADKTAMLGYITVLDCGEKLLQPDGTLGKDTALDQLHLTPKGYALYRASLLPVLKQLLTS